MIMVVVVFAITVRECDDNGDGNCGGSGCEYGGV
jgi:hypothetical protein